MLGRVPAGSERLGRRCVEVELRAAPAVERAVRVLARRGAVDQEQPDPAVGQGGADDDLVGGVARGHGALAAGDGPRVAVLGCGGLRAGGHRTHTGLAVREREQDLTGRDVVEDGLLLVGAQFGDQAPGDQRGVGDGFRRQALACLGQDHHVLDRTGFLGVEPEAEEADLGELVPDLAAPAEVALGHLVELGDVVAAGQHVARDVAQELLFFSQIEVHGWLTIPESWTR